MSSRSFAAVDIGTTKICVMTAEMTDKGPKITGSGAVPSRGIRKGVVVNIEEAAESIKTAVSEASSVSGSKIRSAVIGITGRHITGFSSTGIIGLQGREITAHDRMRAIDSAKTVYIPLDREVLQVLPQEFILDGQTGITDPVGMSGVRLESKVYIITAHSQSLHNLQKASEEAGLEVLDILLQPYASALAVMTKEEIENSTVLMDIGGGTTDIAVFRGVAMIHASILGIGGMHITNDLAVGLDISMAEAERIKRSAGDIFSTANGGVAEIKRQDGTMQTVEMRTIRSIVFPRCEELFEKANEELGMLRPKDRAGCTVILAGGTALMPGITGLASSVLHMPVRSGLPHGPVGLKNSYRSPVYAAGIGLIAHAAEREKIASKVLSASECSFAGKIKEFIGYRDFLDIFHKKKKGVSYV